MLYLLLAQTSCRINSYRWFERPCVSGDATVIPLQHLIEDTSKRKNISVSETKSTFQYTPLAKAQLLTTWLFMTRPLMEHQTHIKFTASQTSNKFIFVSILNCLTRSFSIFCDVSLSSSTESSLVPIYILECIKLTNLIGDNTNWHP